MKQLRTSLVLIACVAAGNVRAGAGGDWEPDRIGLRSGVSATSIEDLFYQTELYGDWWLPWRFDLGWHSTMQTALDVSGGWLAGRGNHGFTGTLAPTFSFGRAAFPLVLELGSGPTYISRTVYDQDDLGGNLQFTSHVCARWEPGTRFTLGYRLQHMSNAHLSDPNPGLNLHCLVLGWRF